MNGLRSYFISIIATAVIAAIVKRLVGEKGTSAAVSKLITSIVLTLAVISPLVKLDFTGMNQFIDAYAFDASEAVEHGSQIAADALAERIKLQTESYILDKAKQLGAELSVQITLTQDTVPTPLSVTIIGNISPYAKSTLQNMIQNDLGIDKEHQTWK